MAETYTGNEGQTALADGMDIMDGTEDRRKGYLAINKTRDYIVTKLTALKAWAETTFLAKSEAAAAGVATGGKLVRYKANTRVTVSSPIEAADAANKLYVDNAIENISIPAGGVPSSGGTFTGNVYFPNASPATSGYAVAYINGDGRLSKNASSARYKENITDSPDLGDIWPQLREYQMVGGDGDRKVGYIAEELYGTPAERFIVWADLGAGLVPDSIDFIALLMAQNAQLHLAVDLLAQRLEALEER